MSLALIEESAKEVRRLAIAGSPLAVGDFRIKKLAAPLEQAGAKVPVFAQVAKAINDLANGIEAESAARLLALSTLLNAILYTQGQTSVNAPFSDLEIFASKCTSTRTTARTLKPLISALTTAGAGRLETLKTAVERGACNDLRLIDPAIQALADGFPEIADLVADKILPAYGPGIIPRLKEGLDLKGKKSDARRLKLIHQLDPAGAVELCKTALDEGIAEVKAAAIECLGQHEECLPLILEQSKSKNKIVRAAALETLAEHEQPAIVKLFNDLIQAADFSLLTRPFRALRSGSVLNSLLTRAQNIFEQMLKSSAEESARQFLEILECLAGRTDAETEIFLLGCFEQSEKISKLKFTSPTATTRAMSAIDVLDRLTTSVYQLGSPRALDAILAKREVVPAGSFYPVLRSALRRWSPEKIYDEFSPLLESSKGPGQFKRDGIQRVMHASFFGDAAQLGIGNFIGYGDMTAGEASQVRWDPRWLDAALKAKLVDFVTVLARPGHKATIDFLLKIVAENKDAQPGSVIRALAFAQYPKVSDTFLELVAARTKTARYFDYNLQRLFDSARYLPMTDLPKLDALAAKLDEKFQDKYLEALAPLRAANQPNQT